MKLVRKKAVLFALAASGVLPLCFGGSACGQVPEKRAERMILIASSNKMHEAVFAQPGVGVGDERDGLWWLNQRAAFDSAKSRA